MTTIETIKQLESIIENAADMSGEVNDVWDKDIEACNNAIRILKEREQMKCHVNQVYGVGGLHNTEFNPDFYSIRIPRVEYRELLKLKASIECVQSMMDGGSYVSQNELCSILGLKEREDENGKASE